MQGDPARGTPPGPAAGPWPMPPPMPLPPPMDFPPAAAQPGAPPSAQPPPAGPAGVHPNAPPAVGIVGTAAAVAPGALAPGVAQGPYWPATGGTGPYAPGPYGPGPFVPGPYPPAGHGPPGYGPPAPGGPQAPTPAGTAVAPVAAATLPQAAAAQPTGPLDALPILERRGDSIWTRAEQVRDGLYKTLQQACAEAGVDALVLKSPPFVQPAWVKFECWVPQQGEGKALTERASAVVSIDPRPFHRYEFVFKVEIDDRGKTRVEHDLMQFAAADGVAVVQWLLRRGPKPSFRPLRLRRHPLQLWRPRNKVDAFGTDGAAFAPAVPLIAGLAALVYGIQQPYDGEPIIALAAFLLVTGFVFWRLLARRQTLVRSAGRPAGEPRELVRVDSWQTVVTGLGPDARRLLERFAKVLRHPPTKEFRARLERIWHWGLDGKEEREQLVLSLGRGMFFVQIYAYDKELYVGWDAHLNVGQWMEKVLGKGIDRQSGRLAVVNTVVPAVQKVSEYDVTDLSCLIEWAHAKLSAEVKHLMEERKIDQEVDFKILRGERQDLLRAGQPADGGAAKPGPGGRTIGGALVGMLRRTG